MCRRSDTLKRKPSGEQRQSHLRSWFSSKRGYRGKNAEQGFAAVIAFVLRERCRLYRHAQAVIQDDSLADSECFMKIEEIIAVFEILGSGGGLRHDFG